MRDNALKVSESFKKAAVKSILSIVLFMVVYVLLVGLAIGLTALCGYLGIMLIVLKPMVLTIMLGVGLISMGFLILFFLMKFIFSKNKVDRSHLLEITAEEQPQLFALINEIVVEVKTTFPKKVYVSSDVNASVFYDSSFWSMFFPVKKNLQIGLGLMNSISAIELKAILAHEFGHFSQRSMKLGSYVYNVNMVLHNMLYDNDSYSSLISGWANISAYFTLFVNLSIKIITGIQAVLKKVYEVVNINYLALSREMEFHADAVAAHVAGSQPLISSLLRLELADQSLNSVFNFYDEKVKTAEKTDNFYPQQYFVINHFAKEQRLPVVDGLPQVSVEQFKRFNKSKLVLKNQWSSHPSTEDRVAQLEILNKPVHTVLSGIAIDLLSNKEALQERVTLRIFEGVKYENAPTIVDMPGFIDGYTARYKEFAFPEVYNGYFDHREPWTKFEETAFNEVLPMAGIAAENLFDNEIIDTIYELKACTADLETIRSIESGQLIVKTFDYDGERYTPQDCPTLVAHLNKQIDDLNEILTKRDSEIFTFFANTASEQHALEILKEKYLDFSSVTSLLVQQQEAYSNLLNSTSFMQVTTPFDQIESGLIEVKKQEKIIKEHISVVLEDSRYQNKITDEIREHLTEYLSKDYKYFDLNMYFDKELDVLFTATGDFYFVVMRTKFELKKSLLDYQAELLLL